MPGRGVAPKPTLSRPNDQARRDASTVTLTADGKVRGPDLPEGDWHPRTLEWWQNWRVSPQAQIMTQTDWDVLAETAIYHTRLWNGEVSVGPELRLRVAKFGATYEDRARLKMQVDAETEAAAATTPKIKPDRRRRLLKAVNDGTA